VFYLDLFRALERHQVDYLLVGGLAVALHGIERSTMDIDIVVATDPRNRASLLALARELELTPVLPVPLTSLDDLSLLQSWHEERHLEAFALKAPGLTGVTLDLLLFPRVNLEEMKGRTVHLSVSGVPVRLASIDDLIALKEVAGRPVDLADISHLRKIQRP